MFPCADLSEEARNQLEKTPDADILNTIQSLQISNSNFPDRKVRLFADSSCGIFYNDQVYVFQRHLGPSKGPSEIPQTSRQYDT